MKKFGLYILLSVSFLWSSCCCLEDRVQSEIKFDNPEALGITHVSISEFRDSIQGTAKISGFETGALIYPGRRSGPEILRSYHGSISLNEKKFVLWLNESDEIVATWDLSDTTQRWADEANWHRDSSICEICAGREDQLKFINHYTFSTIDTLQH